MRQPFIHPYIYAGLPKGLVNINSIIGVIKQEFEIDDIKMKCRKSQYVVARQIAAYIIRSRFKNKTLNDVAKILGYNDHTMIVSCCQVMKNRIATKDNLVYPKYISILNKINSSALEEEVL